MASTAKTTPGRLAAASQRLRDERARSQGDVSEMLGRSAWADAGIYGRKHSDPHLAAPEVGRNPAFEEGKMKKKVLGAQEALEGGVGQVIIADGRVEGPMTRALASSSTLITWGEVKNDIFELECRHSSGVYAKHEMAFVRGVGACRWDHEGRE